MATPCASGNNPSQLQQQQQPAQQQGRFQVIKFLGKGGQGFVQLALDTQTQEHCAIKYIDRGWSRSFYKYVSREILNHAALSLCRHPHIVEFKEVFLTPRYLGVVMEYVNGTNLQQYLEAHGGCLSEDIARFIFQQLMIAVDFCHKNGKVNRDIKLANILLQDGQLPLVKLCDFGFSKDKFDDSEPQTQIGTALFTAPEIFTNVTGQAYDAEGADVWSCGVVLYVLLYGGHPFLSSEDCRMKKHAQVMKLIENSVKGNVHFPPEAAQTPLAMDLISKILVSNPAQRFKIADILQHPWFQEKLPPGALVLNDAYLSMRMSGTEARQSPEAIKHIVRAAVSIDTHETLARGMSLSGMTSSMNASEGSAGEQRAAAAHLLQGQSQGVAQAQGQAGSIMSGQQRPEHPAVSTGSQGQMHSPQQQQQPQQQGWPQGHASTASQGFLPSAHPGTPQQPFVADLALLQQQQQLLYQQQHQQAAVAAAAAAVAAAATAAASAPQQPITGLLGGDSMDLQAELQQLVNDPDLGTNAVASPSGAGFASAATPIAHQHEDPVVAPEHVSPVFGQGGAQAQQKGQPEGVAGAAGAMGMDVSANVLLDSTLLYQMNFEKLPIA